MEDKNNENENSDKLDLALKILIIGDSQVGKTSLLLEYVDKMFPEEHISTIGVEYKEKFIKKDEYDIKLQIWDTAGQERFRSITKSIYRNANGVLFVYDVTNKESFENVKHWIKDTEKIDKDIRGIIIGNKIDLIEKRKILKEDLDELGKKYDMPVLDVSAKNAINVNESFDLIVEELFRNRSKEEIKNMYLRKKKNDLSISSKKTNLKNQKACCK